MLCGRKRICRACAARCEQIVFSNEENGYAVLRLVVAGGRGDHCYRYFSGHRSGRGADSWSDAGSCIRPTASSFRPNAFERRLPTYRPRHRGLPRSSGLIRGIGPRLGGTHRRKVRRGYLRRAAERAGTADRDASGITDRVAPKRSARQYRRAERDARADGFPQRAWSPHRDHGAAVQAVSRQRHRKR